MTDKRHIQRSHDMTASNFDEIGANPIRDNNRRRGLDVRWSTESQLVRRSRAERPTERTVSDEYWPCEWKHGTVASPVYTGDDSAVWLEMKSRTHRSAVRTHAVDPQRQPSTFTPRHSRSPAVVDDAAATSPDSQTFWTWSQRQRLWSLESITATNGITVTVHW